MTDGEFRHTLANRRHWDIVPLSATVEYQRVLRELARDDRARELARRAWQRDIADPWAADCEIVGVAGGQVTIRAAHAAAAFELKRARTRVLARLSRSVPQLRTLAVEIGPADGPVPEDSRENHDRQPDADPSSRRKRRTAARWSDESRGNAHE
jgi:hypothetical protein